MRPGVGAGPTALTGIGKDLPLLTDGVGRDVVGVWRIADDLYGPCDRSRLGLLVRVEVLEKNETDRRKHEARREWMLMGVGIGTGAVVLDIVLGGDMEGLLGRLVG